VFRSKLWVLIQEESSNIINMFDKTDKIKAIKFAIKYAEVSRSELFIHHEDECSQPSKNNIAKRRNEKNSYFISKGANSATAKILK
ncbi:MAG: hypothetical protein V2A54_06155, partial [Bacteroidota bacterium]